MHSPGTPTPPATTRATIVRLVGCLIGPGKAIDTDRWFVVASNILGGCSGTTGPSSVNPETGKPYGLDFPLLDMHDFVVVHRALLTKLGVPHLHAAVAGRWGACRSWTGP